MKLTFKMTQKRDQVLYARVSAGTKKHVRAVQKQLKLSSEAESVELLISIAKEWLSSTEGRAFGTKFTGHSE